VALSPDVLPGMGALGGLYTAIISAGGDLVAVVACDMPFVSLPILSLACERLSGNDADVAIPKTSQGYEPFHAVYRKATCLLPVKRALEAGERRLISWFPSVTITSIEEQDLRLLDPLGLAFQNINTPEELKQAEALARELDRLSARQ
jgi:molybdopterin-guanine dinucleotide biosynthesis protein A